MQQLAVVHEHNGGTHPLHARAYQSALPSEVVTSMPLLPLPAFGQSDASDANVTMAALADVQSHHRAVVVAPAAMQSHHREVLAVSADTQNHHRETVVPSAANCFFDVPEARRPNPGALVALERSVKSGYNPVLMEINERMHAAKQLKRAPLNDDDAWETRTRKAKERHNKR